MEGFYRATCLQGDKILDICNKDGNMAAGFIATTRNPFCYVMISDDNDCLISFAPVIATMPSLYTAHIVAKKEARGRKFRDFVLKTAIWMVENTKAETLFTIIPDHDKKVHRFLSNILGMKRVGTVQGGVVYTGDSSMKEYFKKRISKEK